MILKKCETCRAYNLEDKCRKCGKATKEAHYKFVKIKPNFKRD